MTMEEKTGFGLATEAHGPDPAPVPCPIFRPFAPGILVASPHLRDPNFQKTVILLVEHHQQGALGMILNKPGKLRILDVLRSLEIQWLGDAGTPIWSGGPVMREVCWVLHQPLDLPTKGMLPISDNLVLSSSMERLREIARLRPPHMKFIRGSAGWGAGQLENEMAAGAWLSLPCDHRLALQVPASDMWKRAYEALKIDPAFVMKAEGVH